MGQKRLGTAALHYALPQFQQELQHRMLRRKCTKGRGRAELCTVIEPKTAQEETAFQRKKSLLKQGDLI